MENLSTILSLYRKHCCYSVWKRNVIVLCNYNCWYTSNDYNSRIIGCADSHEETRRKKVNFRIVKIIFPTQKCTIFIKNLKSTSKISGHKRHTPSPPFLKKYRKFCKKKISFNFRPYFNQKLLIILIFFFSLNENFGWHFFVKK